MYTFLAVLIMYTSCVHNHGAAASSVTAASIVHKPTVVQGDRAHGTGAPSTSQLQTEPLSVRRSLYEITWAEYARQTVMTLSEGKPKSDNFAASSETWLISVFSIVFSQDPARSLRHYLQAHASDSTTLSGSLSSSKGSSAAAVSMEETASWSARQHAEDVLAARTSLHCSSSDASPHGAGSSATHDDWADFQSLTRLLQAQNQSMQPDTRYKNDVDLSGVFVHSALTSIAGHKGLKMVTRFMYVHCYEHACNRDGSALDCD